VPAYRKSPALAEWQTSRKANVNELRRAHTLVGNVGPGSGAGRPPKAGTAQINEALVLRTVTEFQGFVRDLLDLATIKSVRSSGCSHQYQAQLISAATRDRWIDRGNPHLEAIKKDTDRLGISQLGARLQAKNHQHASDVLALKDLVELRNALAHGDEGKLLILSRSGLRPTIGYSKTIHGALNRIARALDGVVWDHLSGFFPGTDPWGS
jgi:hypothetical protein